MMVGVSATISQLSPKKDKLRSQDLKCRLHFEDKLSNCKLPVCISSSVRFFVYLRKDLQLKHLLSLSDLCPFFSFPVPNSPHLYHCPARRGEKQIWVLALFIYFFKGTGGVILEVLSFSLQIVWRVTF